MNWASALASKALKPGHWEMLREECNLPDLIQDDELTIASMIAMDVPKYWTTIEDISTKAEKEWKLEKRLSEMQAELKEVVFAVKEYEKAQPPSHVIFDTDDLFTILDDQLVKTQQFLSSSYVGTLKPRCKGKIIEAM